MTPEQIKLVQDSFGKVAPIAETAADIFYDRLFEIAPAQPIYKLQPKCGFRMANIHFLKVPQTMEFCI